MPPTLRFPRRGSRPAVLGLALALFVAMPLPAAHAQLGPLRTVKLADGVYAVLRHNVPEDPSDANSTIIINDHDVIVVDANIAPSSSRAVIAEIRKLTPKPVRYVITTHWHSDHFYGYPAYREAYPGVEFIAHATAREDIIALDLPAFAKNVATDYPAQVENYRKAIARGTRANGERYTPAQIAILKKQQATLEWFLAESRTFTPEPPTMTITDSLVLHRGDRSIVVRHLGRGNTRGDMVVWLPRERILATGDLDVSPIPFAFGSFLGDWVTTLGRLKEFPAQTIVPGHGELQHDWSYVDRVASVLRATLDRVRTAATDGAPLDSVRKRVPLDDFRESFAGHDTNWNRAFDLFRDTAVERALVEVRGEGK